MKSWLLGIMYEAVFMNWNSNSCSPSKFIILNGILNFWMGKAVDFLIASIIIF